MLCLSAGPASPLVGCALAWLQMEVVVWQNCWVAASPEVKCLSSPVASCGPALAGPPSGSMRHGRGARCFLLPSKRWSPQLVTPPPLKLNLESPSPAWLKAQDTFGSGVDSSGCSAVWCAAREVLWKNSGTLASSSLRWVPDGCYCYPCTHSASCTVFPAKSHLVNCVQVQDQ